MTKNEIFLITKNEIQNYRFNEILRSKNYLKSTYSDKEILALANKIGELKIELAKNEDLKTKNRYIQAKKDIIKKIKEKGFDESKIIPNFSCKKCRDNGFLPDGETCDCLKKKYYENLLKNSGTELDLVPTLDNLDVSVYGDKDNKSKLILALKNAKRNGINTILFSGKTGTGKTFIAKSFLKSFILQNNLGLFYDMIELNQLLLSAHLNFNEKDRILFDVLNCDLLVIDDLGCEPVYKNVTNQYLLWLLNERQSGGKITLFTTNFTLNDIRNNYSDRFFSRLMDKNISLKYDFQGTDLRI